MKALVRITCIAGSVAALALMTACNPSSDSSSTGGPTDSESQSSGQGVGAPETPTRDTSNTNGSAAYEPDNTGRNVRDRSDAALTPGDQGSSEADREMTQRIRRALTANDQLSTTAKNIKIITTDGKVTLRGPVNTEQEKTLIESVVRQSGVTTFDNQLEVQTTNQ